MKITRFNKIRGHRVFSAFNWPVALPDFGRFNLVYGWNGAGKTTLSNLFRHLERKEAVTEGEIEFHIDGSSCNGSTLATSNLPQVRVFNRNFVDASVFSITQQMNPIFFLGKDSADKQKEVEGLKELKAKEQQKLDTDTGKKAKAVKALDEFCIREAKAIKELLSSSGYNSYNNYDKATFKFLCTKLAKLDPPPTPLSNDTKLKLKQQKDATPKEKLSALPEVKIEFEGLKQEVVALLGKTVVSQVIPELQADTSIAEWVQTGLSLHKGEKHSRACHFCSSEIPEGRLAQLEAHFNDEYNKLLKELDRLAAKTQQAKQSFKNLELPAKTAFHDHLSDEYAKAAETWAQCVKEGNAFLDAVETLLREKRGKLFQSLEFPPSDGGAPSGHEASLSAINEIITRHNSATDNFQKVISDARAQLAEGLAAEVIGDFKTKSLTIQNLDAGIAILNASIGNFNAKITALEKEVVEHRRPAEELNLELCSYLGRDELRFSLFGNGYQITRNGITATNLSEGERGAIAFLYFLKSLQAKDFSLGSDIVVIDDPVSSLDANSLFCAFGCMKECTKEAGQLFILTHNFGFFRQVKNWFNHMQHQKKSDISLRPARFYMVESTIVGGKRSAALKQLDPLLHQFESEYHYLFKKIREEAASSPTGRGLEEYYGMPNIARRALESFMAFRYPAESGELKQQLDMATFDPAKKARILRFLHTYSHDGKIAEPEHDLSILSETPQVLNDLLDLIKAEDPKHYSEMEKLVTAVSA